MSDFEPRLGEPPHRDARVPSEFWPRLAIGLAGIVVTLIGTMAAQGKDLVTRAEMNEAIREVYVQLEKHAAAEDHHMENIDRTLNDMREYLGRVGEHLGVRQHP